MRKVLMTAAAVALVGLTVTAGTTRTSTVRSPQVLSVRSVQVTQPQKGKALYVHEWALKYGDRGAATSTATPTATPATPSVACPSGAFCAYRESFFQGDVLIYNTCTKIPVPWADEGSYINNLPRGKTATWYNYNGDQIYETPPAPSSNQEVNWAPVFNIQPCTGT